MFKSGGFNVYPREIELALEQCPGVALAAVVPVRDERYFEVGIAFVQHNPGQPCDAGAVLAQLRRELANYKVPKLLIVRDALPMLPIGKLDKQDLRAQAQALWRDQRPNLGRSSARAPAPTSNQTASGATPEEQE